MHAAQLVVARVGGMQTADWDANCKQAIQGTYGCGEGGLAHLSLHELNLLNLRRKTGTS